MHFSARTFARQNGVDPQSAIFFEASHLIIPPTEKIAFLVMDSKRVTQAKAA